MSLFGVGKQHFLGIDFGTSSIKAVELSMRDNQAVLENYGMVHLSVFDRIPELKDASLDTKIIVCLRALVKRLRPQSDSAYVAMPSFIGLMTLIEFPTLSEEELEEAVQFEAHKYIPSALEDVALSWEIVGEHPASEGGPATLEILLVAALNTEVQKYEHYVERTNLRMQLLELETFSIVRSVLGKKPGLHLLIDIGSRATNLVFVEDGLVKVSRNLDVGGKDITRTLMDGLHISQERAEMLKKSSKDFLNQPEVELVFPALQAIVHEAERMLRVFEQKKPEVKCESVVLSGGTAQMAGLPQYFTKTLKLPAVLGNPWERIVFDEGVASEIQKLGPAFSVALGLALSGIDGIMQKKAIGAKRKSFAELFHRK